MSQDILADALNQIRNAKNERKKNVKINKVLKIMKQRGAVKKYKIDAKDKFVEVTIGELFDCKAIKPRFSAKIDQIEKYRRRYLPSRKTGTVVISTSKGLMTHEEAVEKGI